VKGWRTPDIPSDVPPSKHLRSVQVPRIRSAAVSQVANSLAETYQLVRDSLSDPSCGYDPDADVGRTASTEEIRTILGIL